MKTPYTDLPDFHYHSRTIKGVHPSRFDPVISPKFSFSPDEKIMTMGSCFAQHLSRWLVESSFNLLLREQDLFSDGGLFSAKYGNVYTVQQALQLFERAFGEFSVNEKLYVSENGRFIDPLRPSVMPLGMESEEAVLSSRIDHEKAIKELFLNADVLVFTLGLTEAWIRTDDNAILPIAPGVVAGEYIEAEYSFRNFSYEETLSTLETLISKLHAVNPSCKILLTVSPVPLAATYETKHIAVASMASKAILRSVVEATIKKHDFVDYFPSFEIFYTPGVGAGYFDYDARHVLQTGVVHAMRLFKKHYTDSDIDESFPRKIDEQAQEILEYYKNINCDEGKIG